MDYRHNIKSMMNAALVAKKLHELLITGLQSDRVALIVGVLCHDIAHLYDFDFVQP